MSLSAVVAVLVVVLFHLSIKKFKPKKFELELILRAKQQSFSSKLILRPLARSLRAKSLEVDFVKFDSNLDDLLCSSNFSLPRHRFNAAHVHVRLVST